MPQGDPPIPLNEQQRRIAAMLEDFARRCREQILNPPGKTDDARSWHASQAAARLTSIDRELAALSRSLAHLVPASMQSHFDQGLRDANKQLRDAGVMREDEPIRGSFALVSSERARVIVRETADDLAKAARTTLDTTRRAVREINALGLDKRAVRDLITRGTIEGQPKATLGQLRKWATAAADGDGKLWVMKRDGEAMAFDPRTYADLVFQTRSAEAANIATLERLDDKGIHYVTITGSNSANFCTAFVGKVYWTGPGEDPQGLYPHLRELPEGGAPFHPRCTKRYTAFVLGLKSPDEIDAGKPDDATRELHGQSRNEAQKAFTDQKREAVKEKPAAVAKSPPDLRAQAQDARRQLREIGEGFAETDRRLDLERARLSDLINDAIRSDNTTGLFELEPQWTAVVTQQHDLAEQRRRAARQILYVDKPASTTIKATFTDERRDRVNEGVAELSKMVDQDLLPSISISATPTESGRTSRSYYRGGNIFMSKDAPVDVVIHELGHLIEDQSPTLHRAALRFLERRTDGERLRSLRSLTGLRYRRNERARPDKFFDPYVGKDYGGEYTEVISMGIQYIWRDPIAFAARDPDYFEFIFRVLRGDFRD